MQCVRPACHLRQARGTVNRSVLPHGSPRLRHNKIESAANRGVYNFSILSTQSSKISDPLVAARQYFWDAVKARDIDKLVSLLDAETVWMPPNDTSLYGPAEVEDCWKDYFEYFRITAITEPERELTICGELAIEHTTYMIAITPMKGETRIRDNGRMLTIWKQQPDGSWKMWRAIWNSVRPVGSGTNRYMSRLLQKRNRTK